MTINGACKGTPARPQNRADRAGATGRVKVSEEGEGLDMKTGFHILLE